MQVYDLSHDLVNPKTENKDGSAVSQDKNNNILCNHCKRTASNGIRCMGICVADNDY